MIDKINESIFFLRELSENEVIVYNSAKHITLKLDKVGKSFFDIIVKFKKKNECLKHIPVNEHNDFKNFNKALNDINFFSDEEKYFDKSQYLKKFDEDKKLFYLHLTDRCNLKCTYCYNIEYRQNKVDLDFDNWKIILDKILPVSYKIILTGGEVLLHASFSEIIQYIKAFDEKIEISLISNGSMDYEKLNLEDTLKLIHKIDLSCDNIKNDKHERIGFNREIFLKNLNYFEKLNIPKKITIASVWTKDGTENINHLECFCEEKGLGFSMTICIPQHNEDISKIPSINDHFHYLKNKIKLRSTTDEDNEDIGQKKAITCGAASTTFSIDTKGDCFPCQSFCFPKFNLGNLLESDFEDIYNSNIATMLRVANDVNYKDKCRNCNVKYLCSGGCIANTFEMEGNILAFPKVMCPYYKNGALLRLENIAF